jgi:hypothetical protein
MGLSCFSLCGLLTLLLAGREKLLAQQDSYRYDNIKGLELYPRDFRPLLASNIINVVTTPDGFDNFDVGIDFAEQHISSNPNNPLQMVFGVNASGGSTWRHTEDAGLTWAIQNPAGTNSGDPFSAYDSSGNVYLQFLSGSNNPVWRSTNNGVSWTGGVTSAQGGDRNTLAVDQTGGPYGGYLYAGAWIINNTNFCSFARSTNNGASFTVTLTKPNTTPGNMIAIGANVLNGQNVQGGCVYFVAITGTNPYATIFNFFRSTNGGATFDSMSSLTVAGYVGTLNTVNRLVINNARTRPYPMIAADNSFGPYRGRLYLVYASNEPSGDGNKPDIFIQYSTNQGATWTPRSQRVNDNANPGTTNEWFPAIWCDKNSGRLYVKWYDMRDDPTNQRAWVYATYSDNGGQTFAPNVKLSNTDMPYPGIACSPNTNCYRGDYDAIVGAGKVAMAVWTDFRNSTYQNMVAYFPDFAMITSPAADTLGPRDSVDIKIRVPAVKLYTDAAKFSATITPAGNFTFVFPTKDSLTGFPDSTILRVRSNGAAIGTYTVTITGRGPGGTPVHKRTASLVVYPKSRLSLKVILEGPFNQGTGRMDTSLKTSGALAAHFTGIPIPSSAVDSISVEVRDSAIAAKAKIRKFTPAWLLADGSVRGFSDTTKHYVEFDTVAGNYFVVVRHRNHLAIMSASVGPVSAKAGQSSYDFTTAQSQAFGTNPMAQVSSGVYGMISGDVNQSGIVSASDANSVFGVLNATGYNINDVNLSGIVSAADANKVFGNLNKTTQVPEVSSSPPLSPGKVLR